MIFVIGLTKLFLECQYFFSRQIFLLQLLTGLKSKTESYKLVEGGLSEFFSQSTQNRELFELFF